MAAPDTYIGQGKIYLAAIVNGVEQPMQWVGDASALSFSNEVTDKRELYESHTGSRNLYDSTAGKKKTSLSFTLTERRLEAMAVALQAEAQTVAAETNQSVTSGDALKKGDFVSLTAGQVSNVSVTDSSGTPQDLVEGTDYKLDADYGLIELLVDPDAAGITLPLVISFDAGAKTQYKPLTRDVDGYRLRFNGMNEAGKKEKTVIDVYRVNLDPAATLDLINDDFANLEVSGECLYSAENGAAYEVNRIV